MFFSLSKILALVAVIVAVWYGFRLLEAHRLAMRFQQAKAIPDRNLSLIHI